MRIINKKNGRGIFIASFILPTLVLFLIFIVYPLFQGLYYSFFQWSGLTSNTKFIGFSNYSRLLNDPLVLKTVYNDFFIAFYKVIFTVAIALLLAILLTRVKPPGGSICRTVLFFPTVLSIVVISIIFMMIYNPDFGILNSFLKGIGLESLAKPWLGDAKVSLPAVVVPAVWCSAGFYMIVFIAAIENIPKSLFEAAIIDGAGNRQQIFRIILPLIREQINFAVVYLIITSFNGSYLMVKLLTNGGPNNSTQVMGTYLYLNAFNYHKFGYATTIGVMILAVSMIITIVLNRVLRAESYEY